MNCKTEKKNLFFHLSIIFSDVLEFQVLHRQVTETLVPSHFVLSQDFKQMLTPGFLHKQLKSLPGWRQHLFPWGRSIKKVGNHIPINVENLLKNTIKQLKSPGYLHWKLEVAKSGILPLTSTRGICKRNYLILHCQLAHLSSSRM